MNFTALLIALFIDRVFPDASRWRDFSWLRRYFLLVGRQHWLARLAGPGWLGMAALLPLLLLVAWLQYELAPALGGLFVFLFDFVVLLLCLGPRSLDGDADRFIQALEKGEPVAPVFADTSVPDAANGDPGIERVSQGLLIAFCRRYIGPMCWFTLLGPIGAISYRVCERMQEASCSQAAMLPSGQRLFELLNWIPARLTAAGFAVSGDFDAVSQAWKHTQSDPETGSGSDALLVATGQAAIPNRGESGSIQQIEDTLGLAWRTLTLFVAILGVATLLSWI